MKKFLLFFMSLFTFLSYGQLSEGFEGTFPPAGWVTFDNGIGLTRSWGTTAAVGLGWVYAGSKAAIINKEDVPSGIAEDWLVTPLVNVPTDGQLRFFARSTANGEQGSIYKVKISTASQNTSADFTNTIASYTELEIVNAPFEQKIIPLTAYEGQDIYIAFVMENDNGDSWVIDNVNVDQICTATPTNLTVSTSDTSANLSWTYTGPATQFAIEYGPAGFVQGTGTIVSPVTSPYNLLGLTAATSYDFYVSAVCGVDNNSAWTGPQNFTTNLCAVADQCDFVFRLTDDFGDGWNGATMQVIQSGIVVGVIGTTFTDGLGPLNITIPLCSNQPFQLLWNNAGAWPEEVGVQIIDPLGVSLFTMPFNSGALANTTIYSGNAACTPPTCPQPTGIVLSGVNSTSGTVTWIDNAGVAEWEIIIQPAGTGYPASGYPSVIATQVFATTYNFSGLTPGLNYEVYVRAICSAADQSFWSGPVNFSTNPDYCAGSHFYDQGGPTGAYSNSQNNVTTTICADNPGDVITVIFNTFGLESCCDSLSIYDGPTSASPLVGTYAGTALPPQYTATSVSGCLTFVFNSDSSVTGIGWDATIICSPPPPCRQPTDLAFTGISSTEATLSWTDVNVGVTNWQIVVQPAGTGYPTGASTIINATSNPFTVTGLNPNSPYEFYVLSDCGSVDGISFWSGPRTFNTLFPGCNGSTPAGNECPTAAPVCNLDGYCGNTSGTYTVNTWPELTTAFCGSIENNSFLTFQATSTSISLDVNVGNCFNGSDIQFFVFTAANCGSGPVTALDCFFQMNVGSNALTFNGLTPGQVYYLMIDGFAGAICDYSVTVTSGGSTSTDVTLTPVNPTICINETVDLAVTGGNGIYNWSPATGLSAVTGSTVTFTPPAPGVYTVTVQSTDTNALCAISDFVEITVLDLVTPTFNSIAPFCSGTTAPVLQGTSNNGITGTWLPAVVDNLNSGIYTFTPEAGQCATPVDVSITVTPEIVPSFITPAPICSGTAAPVLSNTSNNGITGTWFPALVDNMTSATYTFTPDAGQCASIVTLDVEVLTSCTFGTVASAVMIDNCSTASPGEFFNTTAGSETIGAATNVFPNSNLGTYVQNSGNLVLAGAELRTFKTATSNVCSARLNYRIYEASSAPGAFTVLNLPLFDDCGAGTYPTGGNCNPLEQKWQDISSTIDLTLFPAGDYIVEVFYDVTGDNSSTTLCRDTILLDNNGANYKATFSLQSEPTFVFVNPITCNGTEGFITVSGFNPGEIYSVSYSDDTVIVGPANFIADVNGEILISGLNAGVYADFNFSINGCNIINSNPITLVDPVYNPTFNAIGPFCVGDAIVLPVTSIEGFTGTWSPAVDNTQTIDYTFTPDAGQCATVFSIYTVVVNPVPSVTNITSNSPICFGEDAVFTVTGSPNTTLTYTIGTGASQTTTIDASGDVIITVAAPAVGNVVLNLIDIDNGACVTNLTNTATVIVRALPTVTSLTAINSGICLGSDAAFNITGTPNTTVTYQINGGANQTVPLNATGQSGTITIANPTADVVVLLVDINDGICNTAVANSVTITVNSVPVPTIDITTQSTCAIPTATFEVLSPLSNITNVPSDLFISQVTDEPSLTPSPALTYVEIYNGTGAPVDLSGYKLKVYTSPTPGCETVLSGILANNDVVIIKIATGLNQGGVTPDLDLNTCPGVNNNDRIVLTSLTDVEIDSWGIQGINFTPNNQPGYSYQRNTNVPLPSIIWDPADWTATNWEIGTQDYSDVGIYSLYVSNYEYILDNGTTSTTQASISFTGIAPGTYTLVAHDLLTGCFSNPLTFTINGFTLVDPVTNFTYATPVCVSNLVNPMPDTSAIGFISGGTYAINSTDAIINSLTGEIDLANSTAGTYLVTYSVIADATNCLNAGSSQFEIVINQAILPTFSNLEVCTKSQVQLPTESIEGYTGTWSPALIDTSIAGSTTYYFTPDASCSEVGELTVVVDNCSIQKGISPNGDTLNDYFDLSSYNVSKLQIFNRYGLEVYSKSNYTIEWIGQSNNGDTLPDGTYYYVIEFNDMEAKTGWIYINKER